MAEFPVASDVRVEIWRRGETRPVERLVGIQAGGSKGGTVAIQASFQPEPNIATASHWFTIENLQDLTVGQLYSVGGRTLHLATALAVKDSLAGGDFVLEIR